MSAAVEIMPVLDLSEMARAGRLPFRVGRQRYEGLRGRPGLGGYVALSLETGEVVRELGDDPQAARGTIRMMAASAKVRAQRNQRKAA